jgi:hypothetical protein
MPPPCAADVSVVTPVLRIRTTPALTRRLALVLAVLGALLIAWEAAPAGAVVTELEGSHVGVQPPEIERYWDGTFGSAGLHEEHPELGYKPNSSVSTFSNSAGSPVMHSVKTYAIYWSPEETYYHGDWQGLIDGFLGNLASAGDQSNDVFAVDGQYTDATNRPAAVSSAYLGAYTDTDAYPRNVCVNPEPFEFGAPLSEGAHTCLTDAQIKEQLADFIAGHHLQVGMGTIFYVFTPPGVAVCLESTATPQRCSIELSGAPEHPKVESKPYTKWEEIEEVLNSKQEHEEQEILRQRKDEKEGITFTPVPFAEPTSYKRFENDFCSYHGAIGNGNENTILYAVIPWAAGDAGDYHLPSFTVPGDFCQDGGFAPVTKQGTGELEEKEHTKALSPQELEEYEKKSAKEKREQKEAEELGLKGPHDEEPNQVPERTADGSFDGALADLIVNQIAVEQQNTVTDPLLDAWHDSAGNEVTDECRNLFVPTVGSSSANPSTRAGSLSNQVFNTKPYYVNSAFNLASLKLPYPAIPCIDGIALVPHFTAPELANAGEIVGFDGMESDITLNAGTEYNGSEVKTSYAHYTWNFGDGSGEVSGYAPGAPPGEPGSLCELPWKPPCAGSVFHAYEYGGTYNVTLTVRDVSGRIASITQPVTIVGPPAPTPLPPPVSPGTSTGGTTGSGAGGTGSSSVKTVTVPAPVALASAVTASLAQVARKGLVVHYSVNEKVAGRFEVLLEASVAHRLGISGPAAANLPAGTPQSVVIGHALLVTTRGGHSSVRIKFSKSIAKRLRHAHKVKLTLRLTAHNASTQNPLFTTVMSTVELHR